MDKLTPMQKEEINERLKERGVKLPCPRCGYKNFTLLDGYFLQSIQTQLEGISIGGPSFPSIVTVCNNCGYVSQHSLGILGLIPKRETKNEQKK